MTQDAGQGDGEGGRRGWRCAGPAGRHITVGADQDGPMGFHLVAAGPGGGTEFLNVEGYPVVHGGRCRCLPGPWFCGEQGEFAGVEQVEGRDGAAGVEPQCGARCPGRAQGR